jgi:hypothetical protein
VTSIHGKVNNNPKKSPKQVGKRMKKGTKREEKQQQNCHAHSQAGGANPHTMRSSPRQAIPNSQSDCSVDQKVASRYRRHEQSHSAQLAYHN